MPEATEATEYQKYNNMRSQFNIFNPRSISIEISMILISHSL